MSSFLSEGECYHNGVDILRKKSNEFFKIVAMIGDHLPSVIQRLLPLQQERSCFNVLSVGSGAGEVDMEILKIVKEELKKSPGSHRMKIFNRAIELNKYPCHLYKAAVESLDDKHLDFDIHQKSFEEYKEESTAETTKFDVIHFIHSIYYVDLEETLKHCIENELNDKGCLFFIVQDADITNRVYKKQRFPDSKSPQVKTAEKMFEIAKKYSWKYEVYAQEFFIDVSEVCDPESTEGNLLLDFLTHTKNFRDTADKRLVEETLTLIEDISTVKDGKRIGEGNEQLFVIYKRCAYHL